MVSEPVAAATSAHGDGLGAGQFCLGRSAPRSCLLYTSDAADDLLSDLAIGAGGGLINGIPATVKVLEVNPIRVAQLVTTMVVISSRSVNSTSLVADRVFWKVSTQDPSTLVQEEEVSLVLK